MNSTVPAPRVAHRARRGHRVAAHAPRASRRSTTGDGASSITFCRRRCAVQSRSPRWIDVAVRVGEDLDLDVAAVLDQPLQHQRAVAEGALRLAPRAGRAPAASSSALAHQAHAAPAAAGHRLDEQRKARASRLGAQRRVVLVLARGSPARRARRPRCMRRLASALSPIAAIAAGGGPMNTRPASSAGLREGGVLAQEAVARVHRVGAACGARRRAAPSTRR